MNTGHRTIWGIGAVLLLCWAGMSLAASPPERINFQGVLRDASGAPANGTFPMEYRFFGNGAGACDCGEGNGSAGCTDPACEADVCAIDSFCCNTDWDSVCAFEAEQFASCQACIANEEVLINFQTGLFSVTVTDGLFDTALGKGTILDGSGAGTYGSLGEVFRDYDIVYVEIEVQGEVLSPRIRVESSAYTHNALQLEGKRAAEFLDTSAAAQTKAGDLEVQGDVTVGGDVIFADGSVLKSARPDPPCFDNSDRFADCGNGTVTDQVTGLIWLKAATCLGATNYAAANALAASLGAGTNPSCNLTDGSSPGDWRLPTLEATSPFQLADATGEFASIFAPSCPSPFLLDTAGTGCWGEGDPFTGVLAVNYWSATTSAAAPSFGWDVRLNVGDVFTDAKTEPYFLWPVRDGP
jgi:hypothetical protein